MNDRVAIALAVLGGIVWLLRVFPQSPLARVAFSWLGPKPREAELWSKYQLRWAIYSLDWLAQIAVLFAVVIAASLFVPQARDHPITLAFIFALPLAGGIAVLALLGFLAKAAKARYIGPDPKAERNDDHEAEGNTDV